MDTVDSQLSEH